MSDRQSPIHVVQIIGHFGGGGAERVAWNLAVALQQRGVRSTCVAVRHAGSFAHSNKGPYVVDLEADNVLARRLRGLQRLRGFMREERPDLIHVHGPQSLVFTALACQTTTHRPKLWFTWHDSGAARNQQAVSRSVRWAMRRCDRRFGSSQFVADWLSEQAGGLPVSTFVNGVPETQATEDMQNDTPRIIWAARMVQEKDPQILIRSLATLADEGLRFRATIAGSPYPHLQWFADQTSQLVQEHKLGDLIDMPGWVDDMTALYGQSAIGVQTSHTEGLSMTLLEQMMAGLAIVATDVGDTAVAIEHEKTGLLIPPKDDAALTAALRRLTTDPALRQRLGAAAREKALAQFSLDAMAQRVLHEYQTCAEERSAAPASA